MTALAAIPLLLASFVTAVAAIDIAAERDRPVWLWGVIGLLLPLVGAVLVWLMPPRFGRCESCRERVRPDATACPHCQRERVLVPQS